MHAPVVSCFFGARHGQSGNPPPPICVIVFVQFMLHQTAPSEAIYASLQGHVWGAIGVYRGWPRRFARANPPFGIVSTKRCKCGHVPIFQPISVVDGRLNGHRGTISASELNVAAGAQVASGGRENQVADVILTQVEVGRFSDQRCWHRRQALALALDSGPGGVALARGGRREREKTGSNDKHGGVAVRFNVSFC